MVLRKESMERSLAFAFSALRREELSSGTLKEVAFLQLMVGSLPRLPRPISSSQ